LRYELLPGTSGGTRVSGSLRELVAGLVPSGGTAERVAKGAVWAMGQNVVRRALQLGMLVVLARLIGPKQIGLVGIALLALSAVKRFTNIGFNEALVQDVEENVDEHLNTMWVLEVGRGILVFVVLVALAPFIASLLNDASATNLVRAIGLSPLLLGFRNPGIVYFQKNLDFHKQFVYKVSGTVVQVTVAVGWALVSPTAWALVAGYVAGDGLRAVLSYFVHDYRPRPSFDRGSASQLVDYGKWMTSSSILFFIYSEGDDAFVSWLLGPSVLAFYQYGYRFSNAPATELTNVVSSVMFPAFSKLQNDPGRIRSTFLKTLRVNAVIASPVAFGIAVVAPEFVRTFLGGQWTRMIVPMQILAGFGYLRALGQTFGPIWKAIGRPDLITKLSALRVTLVALTIYPATQRFGIVGTAAVVTAINVFPMMPLDVYIATELLDVDVVSVLREMFFPAAASAVMAAVVWYLGETLPVPPWTELALSVPVGVAMYVGVVSLIEHQSKWDVSGNVRTILANVQR
jgi:PST family polysaccharide transporter/lipopolysaccharide exporter